MIRGYRFALAALFALGTATGVATTVSAQQWGPPAQSKYYHDPSNPATYTAYNTSTATVAQRPQAAQVTPAVRTASRATTQRRTVSTTHRTTPRATTTAQ